ncbi:MAG TPA: hypothetical protein VF677_15205 [Flavobacterium sp.]|jgi:hypothetical protein
MVWSKIKKNVENKFSKKLNKKIQLYITSYGTDYDISDLFSRGWITVDGKEVVNFSTPESFYLNGSDYHFATPTNCAVSKETEFNERNSDKLSEKGEFSKFDLSHCCYAYLDLNIDEAINHKSPIINMLAILDKRLGKRRLLKLNEKEHHPLVRYFLNLRLESETNTYRKN